jgi:hypothetical protein
MISWKIPTFLLENSSERTVLLPANTLPTIDIGPFVTLKNLKSSLVLNNIWIMYWKAGCMNDCTNRLNEFSSKNTKSGGAVIQPKTFKGILIIIHLIFPLFYLQY